MIAVTNGCSLEDHALLQESVGNRYPVTLSLGVATGTSPVQALLGRNRMPARRRQRTGQASPRVPRGPDHRGRLPD